MCRNVITLCLGITLNCLESLYPRPGTLIYSRTRPAVRPKRSRLRVTSVRSYLTAECAGNPELHFESAEVTRVVRDRARRALHAQPLCSGAPSLLAPVPLLSHFIPSVGFQSPSLRPEARGSPISAVLRVFQRSSQIWGRPLAFLVARARPRLSASRPGPPRDPHVSREPHKPILALTPPPCPLSQHKKLHLVLSLCFPLVQHFLW